MCTKLSREVRRTLQTSRGGRKSHIKADLQKEKKAAPICGAKQKTDGGRKLRSEKNKKVASYQQVFSIRGKTNTSFFIIFSHD